MTRKGRLATPAGEGPRRRPDELLGQAERLLGEARAELRHGETKATQGLAVTGAMAIIWLAPLAEAATGPAGTVRPALSWLWWCGCGLWVLAAGLFGWAMLPRLGEPVKGEVAYFGDVHRLAGDRQTLIAALERTARRPRVALLAELIWTSRAAVRRYQLVRAAWICTAMSASVYGVVLL